MFPSLILLMYIVPIHRLVMRIVTEKESKSLDIMKVMGMNESSYWLSWFIYFMFVTSVIAICATAITKTNVLPYSDWSLIFLYFWLYSLSLFGYSVFMSSFFTNAKVASLVSNFLYFITYFADYAVNSPYQPEYQKALAAILPSISMSRALFNILSFENGKFGLQYSNIGETYYNYRVTDSLYLFVLTFIVSFFLGVYLSNVLRLTREDSSNEGLKLSWYYPLSPTYWCGTKRKRFGPVKTSVPPPDSKVSPEP